MTPQVGSVIMRNGDRSLVYAGLMRGVDHVYIDSKGERMGPVPLISAMAREDWRPVNTINRWM